MPDYSSLPSVTALASIPELAEYTESVRVQAARHGIADARAAIRNGKTLSAQDEAIKFAERKRHAPFQIVRNMTGVILHTGLGRAPSSEAWDAGYTNLEFDLATGKRGDRQDHIRPLLCELTGAEDALVVNNGAGAVLLALSALCSRKEVLLSRGQSVEIGGAFRMPDVIKASGCKLVDIGTTNKTRAQDYSDAITPKTAAVLQCHPSNFAVTGFTSSPTTSELAAVAHQNGVLFINDQGNGAMIDFAQFGIHGIETLPQSVAAGADITIGSGDKLLGGPQCGIILGRKDLITKMAKHPLARALRIDKTNLMYLQSRLRAYDDGSYQDIPLFRYLNHSAETVRQWCHAIAPDEAEILETITEVGSGAAPGQGVPSFAVVLSSKHPDELLAELRNKRIIGRIYKGKVWLDPRTADELVTYRNAQDQTMHMNENAGIKRIITRCWEQWK